VDRARTKGSPTCAMVDFDGAFEHAKNIEKTGLFAWNELVGRFSAEQVGDDNVARESSPETYPCFRRKDFNACD